MTPCAWLVAFAALQLTAPAAVWPPPTRAPLLQPADLDRDGVVSEAERADWLARPSARLLPVATPKRAPDDRRLDELPTPDLYDDLSPQLKNRLTPPTDFERAQDAVVRKHKKR